MEIRTLERETHTDCYLTAAASPGADDLTQEIYSAAASLMAQRRIEPIIEKAYGRISRRTDIAAVRRTAFVQHGLSPDLPFVFLEGAPVDRAPFAGLQIWGVAAHDAKASLVRSQSLLYGAVARRLDFAGGRLLYAPAIDGLSAGRAAPPAEQARAMFDRARDLLAAAGFSYRHVVRTWIYLAHILDWYDDFNRVRTEFFRREGVGADPSRLDFPASTGIQGRAGDAACVMDLLALDPGTGASVEPIRSSSRQGHSFDYGSAFSRATDVRYGGRSTIYVSGTASIDRAGKTAHVGDAAAQAQETLECIGALLEDRGGGFANIVQATCFVKHATALAAYDEVVRRLRLPRIPTVTVLADVCRDDLLIEIEAVAII
jgi:enamine deaminase RidA (YjgF/YER057c/UK114 family)